MHPGSFSKLAVDADLTARLTHEAIDLTEAEPGAFAVALCRKEGLESLRANVLAHARSRVGDRDPHEASGRRCGLINFILCIGGFDREHSLAIHRIATIHSKIEDRVIQLIAVDMDLSEGGIEPPFNFDAASERLLKEIRERFDARVNVDCFGR